MKLTNDFVAKAFKDAGQKNLADKIRSAGSIAQIREVAIELIQKIAATDGTFKKEVHDATSDTNSDER